MLRKILCLFAFFSLLHITNHSFAESGDKIKILRDDELENILYDLSYPVFKAAKIKDKEIEFVIINDPQENAFVIGGRIIFINSGLLINNINSPEAIAGIIAHELGHLLAKHNVKRQMQLSETSRSVLYGSILGLAAMTAGIPELGTFLSLGSYNAGFLTMMKYSRQHEAEADKISSNLLTKSGIGTDGLLKFLNSLRERERQISFNPYYLTHPLSKERVSYLRNYVTNNNHYFSDEFIYLYKRAIYKLMAFTTDRVSLYSAQSINNQNNLNYANSIISFRLGKLEQAISLLDELLLQEPNNPYFLELKAQIELSGGKLLNSVSDFSKSYSINTNNDLIAIEYAFAMIKYASSNQIGDKKDEVLLKTIDVLNKNLNKKEDDVISYSLLANAYHLIGKHGESRLCMAERYFLIGEREKSKNELSKAVKLLQPGSPAALRAKDLESVLEEE